MRLLGCVIAAAAVLQLSEALSPTSLYYSCHDEDPAECARLVSNGSCLGWFKNSGDGEVNLSPSFGVVVLSACRQSCRAYIKSHPGDVNATTKPFFSAVGGVDDVVLDPIGDPVNICDVRRGFTLETRNNFLQVLVKTHLAYRDTRHPPFRFSKLGFKKDNVPEHIFDEILRFHANITEGQWEEDECTPGLHNCYEIEHDNEEVEATCSVRKVVAMRRRLLPIDLRIRIGKALQPAAEEWSGMGLNTSAVYGVRRYLRGGFMAAHTDHENTHIVSAIINVAQNTSGGEPWPLDVLDFEGTRHKVFLSPGEMLWYESAKLPHGRTTRFEGVHYDNLFVHFHPRWFHQVPSNRINSLSRAEAETLMKKHARMEAEMGSWL